MSECLVPRKGVLPFECLALELPNAEACYVGSLHCLRKALRSSAAAAWWRLPSMVKLSRFNGLSIGRAQARFLQRLLAAASGVQPSSLQNLWYDSQRRVRHSSMLQAARRQRVRRKSGIMLQMKSCLCWFEVCNYPSLLPRCLRPPDLPL